jgi:hypothetical protein
MEKKNEMIQKYGRNEAEKIIQYSYDHSTDPTKEVLPPPPPVPAPQRISTQSTNQSVLNNIQKYNESMRNMNSSQRIIPPGVNKFSPAYARIIAAKPKASASASIRLGGVYR